MRCFFYYSLPTRGPIFLILLSLLSVTSFASVTIDYGASKCNKAATYTDGSRYSSNLNTVLNHLVQNGSRSGFNTSSYGQSPNKVYGFLQCIGSIPAQNCSYCSQQARSRLQTYCPNNIGGQVWMTYCYLRYENSSFFSKLNTHGEYLTNTQNVRNDAEAFKSIRFNLLSNLSKTASKPESKGFATGSAIYSASRTVYGLVQCWRDISINDCKKCLISAMQNLESCCSRSQGAHAMLGSCTVRYEIYSFYEPAESPSSLSPASSPKGLPPPNSPTTEDKSWKRLSIILGTFGGVILFIVICLFALRRKLKSAIFGEQMTPFTQLEEERHDYAADTELLSKERNSLFSL